MEISLSFLEAVALAGLASLLGQQLARRVPLFDRYAVPAPLIGGLLAALGLALLRGLGMRVDHPVSGYAVDVLVALLTTNMGLHITPKVLREDLLLFAIFFAAGLLEVTRLFPYRYRDRAAEVLDTLGAIFRWWLLGGCP